MHSRAIEFTDQPQRLRIAGRDPTMSLSPIVEDATHLVRQAQNCRPVDRSSAEYVRRVIAARSTRRRFFGAELFADPAWDILLELYALHVEQRRTSVSKLAAAADVPATTALRWIEKLHGDGLLDRDDDVLDARRVWISMSARGVIAMDAYLEELPVASMPL